MTLHRLPSSTTAPPGTWRLDPGHAEIGFWGRHLMLTKVRGRFTDVAATIHIAGEPADSWVEATIQMASVNTGDDTRDEHLRSADLFDVARWPVGTYRSTAVTWDGVHGTVIGDLTLRGVTRPVILDVVLKGTVTDPWGAERMVLSASGVIDRTDWGMSWNMPLDAGGLLVSREIHLEMHLEAVRAA